MNNFHAGIIIFYSARFQAKASELPPPLYPLPFPSLPLALGCCFPHKLWIVKEPANFSLKQTKGDWMASHAAQGPLSLKHFQLVLQGHPLSLAAMQKKIALKPGE